MVEFCGFVNQKSTLKKRSNNFFQKSMKFLRWHKSLKKNAVFNVKSFPILHSIRSPKIICSNVSLSVVQFSHHTWSHQLKLQNFDFYTPLRRPRIHQLVLVGKSRSVHSALCSTIYNRIFCIEHTFYPYLLSMGGTELITTTENYYELNLYMLHVYAKYYDWLLANCTE